MKWTRNMQMKRFESDLTLSTRSKSRLLRSREVKYPVSKQINNSCSSLHYRDEHLVILVLVGWSSGDCGGTTAAIVERISMSQFVHQRGLVHRCRC